MKRINISVGTGRILVVCAVWAALGVVLRLMFRDTTYSWMIWNMLLAVVPLLFSHLATKGRKRRWVSWVWFAIWLLVVPNAFYVVTDLIHLSQLDFYQYGERWGMFGQAIYVQDVEVWLEMFYIASGFLLALLAGLKSLREVAEWLRGKVRDARVYWVAMGSIFVLVGVGVWLGRFLRFNSWDILAPWGIVVRAARELDGFAMAMIFVFAIYVAGAYAGYRYFLERRGGG